MTPAELAQILLSVPRHESVAVKLLTERRAESGELFPSVDVRRQEVQKATAELEEMAKGAAEMCKKLLDLPPVPVCDPGAEDVIGGYCL